MNSKQFTIKMPIGARLLHVNTFPDNQACIWAEVFEKNELEDVKFIIVGTGVQTPGSDYEYFGTYIQSPFYVWHLFVEIEK